MEAFVIDGGDGDRIDTVRVAIEIALVPVRSTIAAGKDENGSFAAAASVDTVDNGFCDEDGWTLHRSAIVGRSPTTAVYGHVLEAKVEGCSFVDIGDGAREDADTSYFGIVCDTNTAIVVLAGGYLTGAASTVMIIEQFWGWEVFVVVEIMRVVGVLEFNKYGVGKGAEKIRTKFAFKSSAL
jgi:hypothetical protein